MITNKSIFDTNFKKIIWYMELSIEGQGGKFLMKPYIAQK